MAKFQVDCPNCETQYRVDDALVGRKARCKHCKTSFVISRPEESSVSIPSPWPWVTRGSSDGTVPYFTLGSPASPVAEDGVPEIWNPGDVILDLYEVLEVFTTGGRGLVYRVRHKAWQVDLAVKCPRLEYFRREEDKESFEQEAETWVKLGLHRHTVNCYYVRRLGGIPRVFAEFVEGGSLAEWIRTKKLYAGGPDQSLKRILDIAIQFAWGLDHAHEQGLVHRDVKPGNVLMTLDGIAKVTDFGMAKARGIATQPPPEDEARSVMVSSGGMTLAFCSPEQVEGDAVSRKTDIWSWGVSVLEMFTGGTTWSGGYLAAGVLQSYLAGEPPDPRLPRMPGMLAELLGQCFQRDPNARPKDLIQIVAVLRKVYRQVAGSPFPREAPHAAEALADSLNNRAVSLLDLNKRTEAETLWEQAVAADPNHPESTYNLGLSRWHAGKMTDEALLQKLHEVCISQPVQWLPLYLLAQVHLDQGNWQAAIETLEKITGAGANLDEVRHALAVAKERLTRSKRCLHTFQGHTDGVFAVCMSADGRFALSGSGDKTLKLWEVATGRCLQTYHGHAEWVTSVCLSGNGRYALSGSADKTLKLWQVANGTCLRTFYGHSKWVLAVALSADGRHAFSGAGDDSIMAWEVASGAALHTFNGHAGPVLCLALTPDGRHIVSGSRDHTLKHWEVASGQCVRTLEGHTDRVLGVALSGDGRHALSGSGDRTVKWWDVGTGRCLRTLDGHTGSVLSVSVSADGRYALSGGEDRTVKLWRIHPGRCLDTFTGHSTTVNSVCLSTGGRYALSGSGDMTMALWGWKDVTAPYVVSQVLPSETALAARTDYEHTLAKAWQAISGGDAVSAAQCVREARAQPGYGRKQEAMNQWSGLYVRLRRKMLSGGWESNTFDEHRDAVTSVCWSGKGRYALSGSADQTIKLWEAATGQCLRTLTGHLDVVTAVAWSGHDYALSASADRTLKLWEVFPGRCLCTFEGHADVVTSVSWSADGRYAVSGSLDRTLKFWEVATGRCLRTLEGHAAPIHSVALSADGRYAISGAAQFLVRNDSERFFTSGEVKLWDTTTGRCIPNFSGHTEAVTSVCWSLDGRYALTGEGQSVTQHETGRLAQSGRLQWWEVATGQALGSFARHADAVTSVGLSLDCRFAVSGSMDRTLKLWETSTGQCLRTFAGHAGAVTSVALSPDGRYALSGSDDRTLKLWALDWELEANHPAEWDEGARPYLETFLTLHTPYAAALPKAGRRTVAEIANSPLTRLFKFSPTNAEIARALTRSGRPVWNDEDFEELLYLLGCAGYGWLRSEGVRRKLEQMARKWNAPPSLVN
jgi:predicted Zn finger-like uncharacterized protein